MMKRLAFTTMLRPHPRQARSLLDRCGRPSRPCCGYDTLPGPVTAPVLSVLGGSTPESERSLRGPGALLDEAETTARERLRKLPGDFVVPTGRLPLAAGRVTFLRRVSVAGTVTLLSQPLRVGKRHRGLYLRLVADTGRGALTAYLNGRVLKRWPYKLLNE